MEHKHTPGPWLFEGRTVYALNEDGFNRFSAWVQDAHTGEEELLANARLIAAAPELLEALQRLLKADHDEHLTPQGVRNLARAAIAKATGAPY